MFILDILELLLAVVVWIVVRKAAKLSVKDFSEAADASLENEEYDTEIEDEEYDANIEDEEYDANIEYAEKEQNPVKSFERIFFKYTVNTAILLTVFTFLIFLSAFDTNENTKYIFLFNDMIWLSAHTLFYFTLSFIIQYVEISAIYLLILVIRGKQRKKAAKSIGVVLVTVVFVFIVFFMYIINNFAVDDGGKCKIYKENGHTLVLQDVNGFLTEETYVFEVRSMTDVQRRETLDCKLNDVIDVEWTEDTATIIYEDPFIFSKSDLSVDVYFSD